MPQQIPISDIPNQEFQITLDNNQWDITLQTTNSVLSADFSLNGVVVITGTRCCSGMRLIPSRYEEDGNFVFVTSNNALPAYALFNVSQSLLYFSAAELAAIRTPPAPPITSAFFNPLAASPLRFSPRGYS